MAKGLHWDKKKLWCNRCNRNVNKWTETILYSMPIQENPDNQDVFCIFCENWLCGEEDAFSLNDPGGW